jgi:hypothetical protein
MSMQIDIFHDFINIHEPTTQFQFHFYMFFVFVTFFGYLLVSPFNISNYSKKFQAFVRFSLNLITTQVRNALYSNQDQNALHYN